MNFLKYLTVIALTATSLFSFGQETDQTEESNRIDQTIAYTLQDFNAKYYSIFKESYKGFASFKGENAQVVDFENGEKESVIEKDGVQTFSVQFFTAMDEAIALKLLEDIKNRILVTSPKGFEQEIVDHANALQNEATLIVYNQDYPAKSAHQPTILIWIGNDFTVNMTVTEPVLK